MTNLVFLCRLTMAMIVLGTASAFPLHAEEKTVHVIDFPEIRWDIPKAITLTIVDEDGKPLADFKASLSMLISRTEIPGEAFHFDEDIFELPDLATDSNGKIRVEIPVEKRKKTPINIRFSIPTQGLFLQTGFVWDISKADDSGLITVPDEVKITVQEGKMFRLNVVGEDGKPVEGAQVGARIDFSLLHFFQNFYPTIQDHPKKYTDENGVCSWGPIPKDFSERRILYDCHIFHPDFIRWPTGEWRLGTSSRFSEKVIDEYTVTLQRGRSISGTVLDKNGQPVVKAYVFVGGQDEGAEKETQTDESGKFEIKGLLDRPLVLLARNPGMVRVVKTIQPDQFDEPQIIEMQPAKTLRVQVVTDQGESFNEQFGFEPLPVEMGDYQYSYNLTYGFQLKDGCWEWDEAPDEKWDYHLRILGSSIAPPGEKQLIYIPEEVYTLRPQEEPHQIILKTEKTDRESHLGIYHDRWILPEKLEIRVLDEDGKPKPDTLVALACHTGNNNWAIQQAPRKLLQNFVTDADGTARFDFSKVRQSTKEFDIWVSAEGCLTTHCLWKSDYRRGGLRFGKPIGERLDILIASNKKTTGFVCDEEGTPIEGAEVTLHRISNCIYQGEKRIGLKQTEPVTTDANGKWECPLVLDILDLNQPYYLDSDYVVVKKDGYLESKTSVRACERLVTLKRAKKITGRVVDENSNPLKGVQISMNDGETMFSPTFGTNTDEEGRFEMSALPVSESKEAGILAYLPGRQPHWQLLDLTHDVENVQFVLKPGATLRLRFEIEEGVTFPDLSIHAAYNRQPQIGPSFQKLKPNQDGVMLLENAPAPTPELEVALTIHPMDEPRRYRPEKNAYTFKYGEEELCIRIIDDKALPPAQRQFGTRCFTSGSRYGSVLYGVASHL